MNWVLAIDPGPTHSAVVSYVGGGIQSGMVCGGGISENYKLLESIKPKRGVCGEDALAVEMIASYGMPVGASVFETCVWIGRFIEAWGGPWYYVYRREVKLYLCDSARAKDGNVRQSLIDRFGPGRRLAIGTKKAPGPLYGFKADMWAALGVAVTFADGESKDGSVAEPAVAEPDVAEPGSPVRG